jgi:uncharacterized UBP type Zn finger protein
VDDDSDGEDLGSEEDGEDDEDFADDESENVDDFIADDEETEAEVPAAFAAPAQPSPGSVAQLQEMGFPEDQCRAALAAAFNDVQRATQFLLEGIPGSDDGPRAPPVGG